jgi:hypothetical protein
MRSAEGERRRVGPWLKLGEHRYRPPCRVRVNLTVFRPLEEHVHIHQTSLLAGLAMPPTYHLQCKRVMMDDGNHLHYPRALSPPPPLLVFVMMKTIIPLDRSSLSEGNQDWVIYSGPSWKRL